MKLRFSRSSLNLIIFTCIILIGWASIDKNRALEDQISDAVGINQQIELQTLEPLNQQSWTSQEGIQVNWQSRLDTEFLIRVRGTRPKEAPSITNTHISWQPTYWQWDISLGADFEMGLTKFSQQLKEFPNALKNQPASIILQGPWSPDIARLTSARLIKDLQLQPLPDLTKVSKSTGHQCPWQPVSAQFWLQDQLLQANESQPNMSEKTWQLPQIPTTSSISQASLNSWKQVFSQQWQANWLKPQKQFDMLSDLAYYRLPANYLLQGYWQINELTPAVLEEYLAQCRRDVR